MDRRSACLCGNTPPHVDVAHCDPVKLGQRVAPLEQRARELVATRDEMQGQRDRAIAEKREAERALVSLIQTLPPAVAVDAQTIEPGSLVILRAEAIGNESERAGLNAMMRWLAKRHPDWTLLLTYPGKDVQVEALPEDKMRQKGWARARPPGEREVLEAALRAHRAALVRVLAVFAAMGGGSPLEAVSREIAALAKQLEAMLAVPVPVGPVPPVHPIPIPSEGRAQP